MILSFEMRARVMATCHAGLLTTMNTNTDTFCVLASGCLAIMRVWLPMESCGHWCAAAWPLVWDVWAVCRVPLPCSSQACFVVLGEVGVALCAIWQSNATLAAFILCFERATWISSAAHLLSPEPLMFLSPQRLEINV